MSDDKTQKLLQGGIKAARSGQKDLARKAFTQVLKIEPNNEAAWLGMVTVSDDAKDKLKILKRILEINPENAQAREALKRLGIDPARLTGGAPEPEPVVEEEIPEPPMAEVIEEDDDEIPMPPMLEDDDDIPMPPMFGDDDDEIPMPPMLGDDDDIPMPPLGDMDDDIPLPPMVAASDDAPKSGGLKSLRKLGTGEVKPISTPDPDLADIPVPDFSPVEELPELTFEVKSSEEFFAKLPQPPAQGQGGLPVPPRDVVERISKQAMADAQGYLEEYLRQYENITWEKKKGGRAGEAEYTVFVLQVTVAVLVFIAIVGGSTGYAIYNSAAAQRYLFGPSDTPTFTPTFTPTNTPGPTNTPSPTPDAPQTATQALDASVTPGNPDQYFPPRSTEIYFVGLENQQVETAVAVNDTGDTNEAIDLLEEEIGAVSPFEFTPRYYLVNYYLEQGEPDDAQDLIDEWLDENNIGEDEGQVQDALPYLPYVDVAQANINLYRVRENQLGGRGVDGLLTEAEEHLTDVLNQEEDGTGDIEFLDAYLAMAERYRLSNQFDDAEEILSEAIQSRGFYGSTEARLKRVQIYEAQERYAAAQQELYNILLLDPFLEEALIKQVEIALESGQAGLGVLYSQQYILYYPGKVRGYYLLGQAREAENKNDEAINAYSRALLGNEDDPYYLAALQARTDLYLEQGRFALAQADLSQALDLTDDDPNVRLQRMNVAFITGDTEAALADAEALLESGDVDNSLVYLLQGRILVDSEDYSAGLESLNQALASGLSAENMPIANEYVARANLATNNLNAASEAINLAISAEETATRRFIRGQINQQQGNLAEALADYEFIVTWGQFYNYPFMEEAQARYDEVLQRLGRR